MDPRESAAWIAGKLREAKHTALFAGGCVRDRLLGLAPTDYDVATSATPDQIKQVFPRAMGVGESFGVMLVRHGGRAVEVATFRADGPYDDHRRPAHIEFTDAEHDALRRDFTVNGLFEDPETGQVIDYVGGRADLDARILRAIGDPRERLQEDRLRTLRAARFAARFSLEIEPQTLAAVRAIAHDLAGVSRERIGNEVRRMLAHRSRVRAVQLCEALGLAAVSLREPPQPLDAAFLAGLPADAEVTTALAAWLLGRGSGGASRARVNAWRSALMLSNDETEQLAATLHLRARVLEEWPTSDAAARKRMAAQAAFGPAMQLVAAVQPEAAADIASHVEQLAASGLAPPPFVTGDDLVRLGMTPGPAFKTILDRLYDQQLNGLLASKEDALKAAGAHTR
jgi:tRNA nucleotidyltransferase/poly(A) polymerase